MNGSALAPPLPAARSAAPAPAPAPTPGVGRLPRRFWTRTFLAAPAAVALTLLGRVLAGTVMPIAPAFAPLHVPPIAVLTAVGLHAAAVVLALCFRFTVHPLRWYRRIAVAVLLASVVPDVALLATGVPGATPASVGLLVVLHLVAGAVGLWLLPALAVGRGWPDPGRPDRGRPPAHPTPAASPFEASPFKDGATSFGTFYLLHYLLAVYPDDATAARAAEALRAAGFAADDVVEAPGAEVVQHAQDVRSEQGVLTRLREQWSRLYTDGAEASRQLVDLAGRGAAFVLAYAPEDAQWNRAADAVRPLRPAILRYYGAFTVTNLG